MKKSLEGPVWWGGWQESEPPPPPPQGLHISCSRRSAGWLGAHRTPGAGAQEVGLTFQHLHDHQDQRRRLSSANCLF